MGGNTRLTDPVDLDAYAVKSALDVTTGRPQAEPILSILDEWSRYTITKQLYIWEEKINPETLERELRPTKTKYDDIEEAAGYAVSHLNLLVNYDWEESRSQYLKWRVRWYNPLRYKYSRNPEAMDIITAINDVYERNLLGGASGGSHQGFIESIMGAVRKVMIGRQEEKK